MSQEKEKFKPAPPYADRKPPRGMQFAEPDPPCKICRHPTTLILSDGPERTRWCRYCLTVQ